MKETGEDVRDAEGEGKGKEEAIRSRKERET